MPEAAAPPDAATQALLAQLQAQPGRAVRALATLRPGDAARTQALAALRAAGAPPADGIAGRPLLVIEVNAAQLRALLASGQVVRVEPDTPVPTN